MLILNFIEDNFTHTRAAKIIETIELLEEFNVVNVIQTLEGAVFDNTEIDTAAQIMAINEIIVNALNSVLYEHHIVSLDLTRDLELLYNMVASLSIVTDDYDPSYILERINFELSDSNEAIDIYSAIVGLVTSSKSDDVMEAIYRIDDKVVKAIFQILEERRVKETDILDVDGDNAELYRNFLAGRRVGVIYDLIQGGLKIGQYEFPILFSLVESYLTNLKRDELIYEIISMVLISNYEDTSIEELFDKAARVFGETEAEYKMLLSDIRRNYIIVDSGEL